MKICHVNLANGFSGGERQTINLIQELHKLGVRQSIVVKTKSPIPDYLQKLPIEIYFTDHNLKGHFGRIQLSNDTVLHAHDGKAVYWCFVEGLLRKNKYIITRRVMHDLKNNAVTRMAYTQASSVACISSAVMSKVNDLSAEIKTTCVYDSYSSGFADPDVVRKIRSRFPSKFLVGQIGRLVPLKGVQYTIEVARKVQFECPDIQFLIIGSGSYESELRKLASGLVNISFEGYQKDISNYFSALDLFLFPTLSEGLGSSILEAWNHDTPVIASNIDGIPDLINNGENGILVEPENVEAFAHEVVNLFHDVQIRKKIAEAAKSTLGQFSPEHIAETYVNLYSSLG